MKKIMFLSLLITTIVSGADIELSPSDYAISSASIFELENNSCVNRLITSGIISTLTSSEQEQLQSSILYGILVVLLRIGIQQGKINAMYRATIENIFTNFMANNLSQITAQCASI